MREHPGRVSTATAAALLGLKRPSRQYSLMVNSDLQTSWANCPVVYHSRTVRCSTSAESIASMRSSLSSMDARRGGVAVFLADLGLVGMDAVGDVS